MLDNLNKLKDQLENFRDHDFRKGQPESIEFAIDSVRKVQVVCAPTGSGKSLSSVIAGLAHDKFLYLCSSKQLQKQIENEFPEVKVMWGRNNFICDAYNDLKASECPYKGMDLQSDNGMKEIVKDCKERCSYEIRKREVLSHPYQVLNYTYFLFESNFVGQFSDYPIIICDEADTIEQHISNFIILNISKYMLDRLKITPPKYKTSTSKKGLPAWKEWAINTIGKVKYNINYTKRQINKSDPRKSLQLKRYLESLNSMKFKLEVFAESMDDTWLFDEVKDFKGKVKAWEFKPTWLSEALTKKFFFRHSKKFLFMSATFPPLRVLSKQLGVNVGDLDYMEIESTFPVENREVYLKPSGDLSYKSFDRDLPGILKSIKEILADHPNEKGIIHTVSWKLNKAIMDIGDPRLGTHNNANKLDIIDKFIRSERPLVLVTPSSERGLDLAGDRCRFSIIAKMPYLSLGDKLVSSRLYNSAIGDYWYVSDAAQKIVQACGRGVRSKEDWCKTYIIDTQACDRIKQKDNITMFPKYWRRACERI